MLETTSKDWTCSKCGSEWINVITWEKVKENEKSTSSVSISCLNPKCLHTWSMMGKPGEKITKVETVPKKKS